jgi:hypothetical protein
MAGDGLPEAARLLRCTGLGDEVLVPEVSGDGRHRLADHVVLRTPLESHVILPLVARSEHNLIETNPKLEKAQKDELRLVY